MWVIELVREGLVIFLEQKLVRELKNPTIKQKFSVISVPSIF
jgi:hypothetical protein